MTVLMRCLPAGLCLILSALIGIQANQGLDVPKDLLDKAVEDEITSKLSADLLQSIEKKFQVDLQRSVDMVLVKIKLLLQNGTSHIQDKMTELQSTMYALRDAATDEVDDCLAKKQNVTTALAEKALHQMVVCGYALIGHDPAHALRKVMAMKQMISTGLKPIHEQKTEINNLLRACGHDHESLKKVIKCVISKSPIIKSAMMDVTGSLINGVVDLTKLMAHGAMHEACLIEVIKAVEEDAYHIVKDVQNCVHGNNTEVLDKVVNYMAKNNATMIEAKKRTSTVDVATTTKAPLKDITNDIVNKVEHAADEVKKMMRRMGFGGPANLKRSYHDEMFNLQQNLGLANNAIPDEY